MATLTTTYQMLDQKLLGTDDYGAKLYVRIYAKYSEQDITNNQTKVQYQGRAYFDKSWSIWDRQSNGSVSGTSATTKSFSRSADYGSGETILETTEAWVSHDNDGKKSISASANLRFPNWGWNNTASGTADLPTIPRASKITATSANIGETSQISVTRYSDSFRHTIAFSFGSVNGYILEDGSVTSIPTKINATSIGFPIPTSWYNEIPNATESDCTLTITTYNGNDSIGTAQTTTFKARVGVDVSVSGTVEDTNNSTYALTGNRNILIKGYSNAKVTWSASPTPGASLSSVKINGNSVSSSPYSFILNDSQISIIATDSRGKNNTSNPYHPSFTLKDYFRPNLATTLEREAPTSSLAKLSFSGIFFNQSFGAVANSLSIVWNYKESGAAEWITGGTLVQNADYKISGNNFWSGSGSSKSDITIGGSFNYEKSWDIQLIITDRLSSYTVIGTITKGVPIVNWEEEFFNVNGKLNLYGITIIKHIANVLWPVNSIYMSVSQDLPSFLSGEWTLLDTLVNGSHTYYIYKRTSEDELLYYNSDKVQYSGEDIYIDNNLLKGDDVL